MIDEEADCPGCDGRGVIVASRPVCCGNLSDSGGCWGGCAESEEYEEECPVCGGRRVLPPAYFQSGDFAYD